MRILRNLLILAILLGVFAVFGVARAYPAIRGWQTVTLHGISMQPTIPLSALVYLEPDPSPAIGQVVTFRHGSQLVTHRIVGDWSGIGKGPWQTQGDNNDAPDADLVPSSAIVGQAVGYLPVVGLVADLLQQVPVMAFLLLLVALLLYL